MVVVVQAFFYCGGFLFWWMRMSVTESDTDTDTYSTYTQQDGVRARSRDIGSRSQEEACSEAVVFRNVLSHLNNGRRGK